MPIINQVVSGGGTTPTGTKSITANGTYDVTDYANADVQVPTTAPASYRAFELDADGKLKNSTSTPWVPLPAGTTDISNFLLAYSYKDTPANILSGAIDLSSLTKIDGNYAFSYAFQNCTGITSVDLSSLTKISGMNSCQNMFTDCTGIITVDLSSLNSVNQMYGCNSMFSGCTGITNLNLSSLKSANGNYSCSFMFKNCTGLTGSLDLSSLALVGGATACQGMFYGCTGITNANLNSLLSVTGVNGCNQMFYDCTNLSSVNLSCLCKLGTSNQLSQMFTNTALTTLSFPNLAYTSANYNSAFSSTLSGVTGCTVHFPSDWQTAMSSWTNITNGLGGTNTTVLFDLPAVTTLDLSCITSVVDVSLQNFVQNNYFPNVTSINLSSLTTIDLNNGCSSMFSGNTNLTTVDLSSLATVNGNNACQSMFKDCTSLTSINLSSLTSITGTNSLQYMFQNCTSLTSLSFPALKTVENSSVVAFMLNGTTGCTVHFPSNLSSYAFNCGGTNTTVLYDLPATE